MKKILAFAILLMVSISSFAQKGKTKKYEGPALVSCGQCQFKMKGAGCTLAVKIKDNTYYVDGKDIEDFGDAHAEDGFCNAIHPATVSGQVKNGRFKADKITLKKKG